MLFNKKLLAATLVTASGFAAISSANATDSGTMAVSMDVQASCVVTAGTAIALAGKSDAGAPAAIGSTFQVACSNTTPYSVSMTSANPGVGESQGLLKSDTTSNTATLAYQLTTDAEGTTAWAAGLKNNATTGGTGTATAGNKDFTVYAKVTGTNMNALIPGIYKDTVTIGVNY